jgi:hypothetical protein
VKAFLSYALSLGGLALVIATIAGAYASALSYPAARLNMINMLRTSANKAELMCKAAKGSFYEALGGAIKLAIMVPTNDLNIIGMTTKPGYDAGVTQVNLHWKALFGRGKKGAALTVAALVIAIATKTTPVLHIIVVVITAVAAVWFMKTKMDTESSLLRAKAEILPEVDRAFAEGRYVRAG